MTGAADPMAAGADTVHVLVVEDSATQAASLALLLERAGFATLIARRGERALALLERERIDLVLSDIVMPEMDGYELCRRIKANREWTHIPVVLLTSVTDPLAIVRGLASGADHYITKPYDADRLLGRLRFVLQGGSQRGPKDPEPVDIDLLGTTFRIRATKEQILDLLVASYSDLVHTSEAVREAEARARFLAEATELLSATLDPQRVLADLAALVVPRIGDVCVTDLVSRSGTRTRVAAVHALPGMDTMEHTESPQQVARLEKVMAAREMRVIRLTDAAAACTLTTDEVLLRALLEGGPRELLIVPLVARDQVLGVLQVVSAPAAHGTPSEVVAQVLDLARRAALAVDNALLYQEAQRATRARDDVLAIVSHDLRNPLNTIHMSTSFLLEQLIAPDGSHGALPTSLPLVPQLQVVQRATRRANALIQDLLDVSRIDAGTLAVSTSAVRGPMLIDDAVLELTPLFAGKDVTFEHAWEGRDVLLAADRSRIAQVFSNLVGNALKFTPKGGTVRIEGHGRDDSAEFVVIDTGSGITPEQVPHLFDRFWQASPASRSGAGLGLFIVKGLIDAHGGTLAVESTPGEGTRFRFTLPGAMSAEGGGPGKPISD